MHWLLIGYMFLFIHRPFEVWPALGDMHVERIYMCATLAVWAMYPGKRWLSNPLHAAFAAFALAVLVCWGMSPWMERSQPMVGTTSRSSSSTFFSSPPSRMNMP
jgi:hypothetical protein